MQKEDALSDLPNTLKQALHKVDASKLAAPKSSHAPKILLLCGSLRKISYSRLLTQEAARLLIACIRKEEPVKHIILDAELVARDQRPPAKARKKPAQAAVT